MAIVPTPDPFVAALDALFASPMAKDAVFQAAGTGPATPIRVIRSQPDELTNGTIQGTEIFEIRVSDVAEPSDGDTLTIGADVFELMGDPRIDVEGLTWTIGASAA